MRFFKNKISRSKTEIELDKAEYYAATLDWVYEIHESQGLWLRRLMIAFIAVTCMLLLSILSTFFLFPLKRTEPYLYTFNNATGEITKIGKLEPTQLSSHWQMTRFLLTRYVMNREKYDYFDIDYPYQIAWAMSSPAIQRAYEGEVSSNNMHSPYQKYNKDKYITVIVKTINQLNDKTVEIRFDKMLHDRNSETKQISHQAAIVKWQYTQPETTQRMLDRDPLGFKITYYQTSPVTLNDNI